MFDNDGESAAVSENKWLKGWLGSCDGDLFEGNLFEGEIAKKSQGTDTRTHST